MWYERTNRPFGDSGWYEQKAGMGALGWSERWTAIGCRATSDYPLCVCAADGYDDSIASRYCTRRGNACTTSATAAYPNGLPGHWYNCQEALRAATPVSTGGGTTPGGKGSGGGTSTTPGTGGKGTGTSGGAAGSCERSATGGSEYWYGVQQALCRAGYPFPQHGIDGRSGDETSGIIRLFQQARGLTVNGRVDAATASALNTSAQPSGGGGGGGGGGQITTPTETNPTTQEAGILSQFFDYRNPLLWLTLAGVAATVGGTWYYLRKRHQEAPYEGLSDTGLEREIYERAAEQEEEARITPTQKRRIR